MSRLEEEVDFLSVQINMSTLFYDCPDQGADDYWFFVTPNTGFYTEGFYLVSSKYRFVVDYKSEHGEGLRALPLRFRGAITQSGSSPQIAKFLPSIMMVKGNICGASSIASM